MPIREPYRFGIQEVDEVNQTVLNCYQSRMSLAISCEHIDIAGQGYKPLRKRQISV